MDSKREIIRTDRMTAGKMKKILPMAPGTKNNGQNAAIVVKIENTTGVATSQHPLIDASMGPSPKLRW